MNAAYTQVLTVHLRVSTLSRNFPVEWDIPFGFLSRIFHFWRQVANASYKAQCSALIGWFFNSCDWCTSILSVWNFIYRIILFKTLSWTEILEAWMPTIKKHHKEQKVLWGHKLRWESIYNIPISSNNFFSKRLLKGP